MAIRHDLNIDIMIQEEKQLLLRDLCARLPYHVRCKIWLEDGTTEEGTLDLQHNYGDVLQDAFFYHRIKDIKPYLRPMSSMTEEEEDELCKLCTLSDCNINADWECCGVEIIQSHPRYGTYFSTDYSVIDWLNKKMFDYRGLIPRRLAISTEEFNPYEN